MGKIMRNGISYSSAGGSSNITELTKAEYDKLVEENTVNPETVYFITDANLNESGEKINSASSITYDNSTSGFEATNVQGVVDEIDTKVDAIQIGLDQVNTNVSELNQNFRDGVNTIVSAVNTKAGTSLTGANTPNEIAETVLNIETDIKHTVKVRLIADDYSSDASNPRYWTQVQVSIDNVNSGAWATIWSGNVSTNNQSKPSVTKTYSI